jgi:hypothetical protein
VKHIACMRGLRKDYKISVGKPEGNKPMRPRQR